MTPPASPTYKPRHRTLARYATACHDLRLAVVSPTCFVTAMYRLPPPSRESSPSPRPSVRRARTATVPSARPLHPLRAVTRPCPAPAPLSSSHRLPCVTPAILTAVSAPLPSSYAPTPSCTVHMSAPTAAALGHDKADTRRSRRRSPLPCVACCAAAGDDSLSCPRRAPSPRRAALCPVSVSLCELCHHCY
ncbi:uncharacterized protein C8Q71DRAFT_150517 [Rhodofomes roseus]|uniref:Uncharacterized protein n=1 Tax=Rhodofomes roseus TaxID=34475 RepID=A0ABQ8KAS8_9APHY|nr:uncharacterized protein C8Q71DRAFT_150517 [Rhodofomes roseus]KAH9834616.1 hypothetical protein C8Q71DRAFT_150517 [Rhodofomes roseus]